MNERLNIITTQKYFQFIQIRIKNFSTTLLNKEKGPLATISVPNVDLLFEGCVVSRKRTLFIALALQHIKVSPYKFIPHYNGTRNLSANASYSQSLLHTINKILLVSHHKHAWLK